MRFLGGIGLEFYLKKSTFFIFPIVIKLKINIDNNVHKNKILHKYMTWSFCLRVSGSNPSLNYFCNYFFNFFPIILIKYKTNVG